jgi:hypothetical protein
MCLPAILATCLSIKSNCRTLSSSRTHGFSFNPLELLSTRCLGKFFISSMLKIIHCLNLAQMIIIPYKISIQLINHWQHYLHFKFIYLFFASFPSTSTHNSYFNSSKIRFYSLIKIKI